MLLKLVIIPGVNQRTSIQVTSAGNNSKILASTRWSSPMMHLLCIKESYLCKLWLWKGQWGHNTKIFLWRKGKKKKQPTKKPKHMQNPNQPTNNKNKFGLFLHKSKSSFCLNTYAWSFLMDFQGIGNVSAQERVNNFRLITCWILTCINPVQNQNVCFS